LVAFGDLAICDLAIETNPGADVDEEITKSPNQ
jgi:hypothetical protein